MTMIHRRSFTAFVLGLGLALVGGTEIGNGVAFAQDSPREVADRIDRHGDRYANGGNTSGERAAREAAREARDSSPEHAREIERDFNAGRR